MCDVHLIESRREVRGDVQGNCCYCNRPIEGDCIYVVGCLDDGTPGELAFAYHRDCAEEMQYDDEAIRENEGCFSYGAPLHERPLPRLVA